MKTINPAHTVAFSGHRPNKIFSQGNPFNLEYEIRNQLYLTISKLHQQGYRNFITGMAAGFDLWAGHVVMLLKELKEFSHIKLIAAVPYADQKKSLDEHEQKLYDQIMDATDHREILSQHKSSGCFYRRNDWMLEHSSVLVAYFNGTPGGTQYTVNHAKERGHKIINVCEALTDN